MTGSRTPPPVALLRDRRALHARRRRLRPLLAVTGALVVVVILGWVVLGSGLFSVHRVTVRGTKLLSAAQVRAAAALDRGAPLLTLDTAAVHDRLAALPQLATVHVGRDWPSTVVIEVVERTPVAMVKLPGANAGVDLVAADGVVIGHPASSSLPVLDLGSASLSSPRAGAMLTVLAGLPVPLRAVVGGASASSSRTVTLALTGNRSVVWGSPQASRRKAAVLAALLRRPAAVYDVSSPDVATTR